MSLEDQPGGLGGSVSLGGQREGAVEEAASVLWSYQQFPSKLSVKLKHFLSISVSNEVSWLLNWFLC